MKLNEAMSNRLNKLMKERNLNPYKLGRKTGFPVTTIQNILNCNVKDVKFSTLVIIAHALEMRTCEFLDDPSLDFDNLTFKKF